ncbi:hypothetical protein PV326_008339 [Microctonus aethiopoides]|nr:hypothetical protein PV326_008339 [Microctonus aethiopoides]
MGLTPHYAREALRRDLARGSVCGNGSSEVGTKETEGWLTRWLGDTTEGCLRRIKHGPSVYALLAAGPSHAAPLEGLRIVSNDGRRLESQCCVSYTSRFSLTVVVDLLFRLFAQLNHQFTWSALK